MPALNLGTTVESFSPLSSLPPEIADIICAELETPDVISLRLVSRSWSYVATPRLLPTVHLVFKADSFQRLVDISKHPVIRHHVTCLLYEPATLRGYRSREEWQDNMVPPAETPWYDVPRPPPPRANEREQRVCRRRVVRLYMSHQSRRGLHPQAYLRQAYAEYIRLYNEQCGLRRNNYGAATILNAMTRLPKLSEIRMYSGSVVVRPSDYFTQAYTATLQKPEGNYEHIEPYGVAQSRSLLLGAAHAQLNITHLQLNITHLELGAVDERFLQQTNKVLRDMKTAVKCLRVLKLEMLTETGLRRNTNGYVDEFGEIQDHFRLVELFSAAPALEDLALFYNPYQDMNSAYKLRYIVGSFTWSVLRSLNFGRFETNQEEWVAFFNRHSPSLRDLTIHDIRLLSGTWALTLERMSVLLELASAEVYGDLRCVDPPENWYLDSDAEAVDGGIRNQCIDTTKAVEEYLVSGGVCPLRDKAAHPHTWYQRR